MIYSAFDWYSGKYRVFQDSLQVPIMSDPKSCAPTYRNPIGVDVNAALCPVPPNAKFVGWSDVAKGQVSRYGAGASGITNYGNAGPNLGGFGYLGLGQTVPVATQPLELHQAVIYSTIISIVSGLVSAWFFKHVRVPK